jgi:hypothetical protein
MIISLNAQIIVSACSCFKRNCALASFPLMWALVHVTLCPAIEKYCQWHTRCIRNVWREWDRVSIELKSMRDLRFRCLPV